MKPDSPHPRTRILAGELVLPTWIMMAGSICSPPMGMFVLKSTKLETERLGERSRLFFPRDARAKGIIRVLQ
jgi:hypothetical protein